MTNPSPFSIVPSLFLLLLTMLGTPVSSLALPQEEPLLRSPQDQQDREGVRPPVVYLMVAGSRPGIVAGIVMGSPPAFGLRPDLVEVFHAAASLRRMRVDVTIYPERANYLLAIDESGPAWSAHHRWTLVDAASGVILRQDSGLLLQNALYDALGTIRRLWSSQGRTVQQR
jgi:hypothetical protein